MTPGRQEWAGALAVGLALRLLAAHHHAWWGDETFVLGIALLPPAEAWAALRPDLHPPLFPLLVLLWTSLFGVGPILSRGPALLAGVAMHAGAVALAGRAAPPHRMAWATRAALWVGALWGFLLVPGVELRHYGLASAGAALALTGSLSALAGEDEPRGSALVAGVGLVLLVHLQAQGWLLVAAVGLAALARRRRKLAAAVLVASLVGAPQLADSASKFLAFQEHVRPALGLKRLLGPAVQLAAGFRVANVTPTELMADTPALAWLALVGGALGIALVGLVRLRARPGVLLLGWVLVAVAGGVALLAPGGYQARYLALLGPPGLALLIAGLAASPAPRLGLAALLVANAWSSAVVARLPHDPVHREDSRAAIRWLVEAPPGTRPALVVFGPAALLEVEGRAAWGREHPGVGLAGVPVHDPTALARELVRGAPPHVRMVASRQEYLDPAQARALEEAMGSHGYQVAARQRFGDHLPAWEFRRRSKGRSPAGRR